MDSGLWIALKFERLIHNLESIIHNHLHSVLIESTGLLIAAFKLCNPTVISAMVVAIKNFIQGRWQNPVKS